jgi:acetyl-CoA carboxylase biotin carboxyl carrier protein
MRSRGDRDLDLRKIKKLIEVVEESGISELEVKDGDQAIRIARSVRVERTPVIGPDMSGEPTTDATRTVKADGGSVVRPEAYLLRAPMSGKFYRSPAPGEAPFTYEGQTVAVGDVLCIIESMKMMNRIESERAGTLVQVLQEDGRGIETGTALFRII